MHTIITYPYAVRALPWQPCLCCCLCLMFLCLSCAWAHGCVFVCVGHGPLCPASLFPITPPPCLVQVLVYLIVSTWSLCALLLYMVLLFPLVFAGSFVSLVLLELLSILLCWFLLCSTSPPWSLVLLTWLSFGASRIIIPRAKLGVAWAAT